MANEIVKQNTSIIHNVDDLGRIGKMMAESGYFTDARGAAQAGVKVLAGQEMGFGAFASMTGIYIIQGRPSVGANLMASAVKANPKYDYRVREHNNNICKIEFFEIIDGKRESIGISEFTLQDAKTAGVKNLDKYARNMLFARAMSNGIRWYCPDVFAGNTTYTPEELGADVDGEGNVLKIESTTPAFHAPEPAIEAEVIEGTVVTPAPEKPVETQEKPVFDDEEFLRNWTHRAGLPPMTLEEAFEYTTSKGKPFAKCTVAEFSFMLNAYQKRLENPNNSQEVKEDAAFKMAAINEILTAKASALKALEERPDPFVKKVQNA